jgi:hypothetical protein
VNAQLLIDSIVQQTTVLIGQLATATGIRAPLSRIADQVFLELSRELFEQGVPRRIAAGMFGLPLRSYQKKLRRLAESKTYAGVTLWESVFAFIRDERHVRRQEIRAHFRRDDEREVGAVLSDLVASGLVCQTGRGSSAVYAVTSEDGLRALWEGEEHEHAVAQVWLTAHDSPGISVDELRARRPGTEPAIQQAVAELVGEGKLRVEEVAGEQRLYATALVIEVGAEVGWEVAVFDHFRAVVNAISTKVRRGSTASAEDDVTGGMTLSFELWPGHPHEARVRGLLAEVRERVNQVWREVEDHNARQPGDNHRQRIYFYAGQYEEPEDDAKPSSDPQAPGTTP